MLARLVRKFGQTEYVTLLTEKKLYVVLVVVPAVADHMKVIVSGGLTKNFTDDRGMMMNVMHTGMLYRDSSLR
jgi:hypothetical protein